MDHVPVFVGMNRQDLSPGPGEFRFANPLLLNDKAVAGDMEGVIGGVFSTDNPDSAVVVYTPGEGRFLLSLVPVKDASTARVMLNRISFAQGGHSCEFVTGAPVPRTGVMWVLHQPNFKPTQMSQSVGSISVSTMQLVESKPGVWVAKDEAN